MCYFSRFTVYLEYGQFKENITTIILLSDIIIMRPELAELHLNSTILTNHPLQSTPYGVIHILPLPNVATAIPLTSM